MQPIVIGPNRFSLNYACELRNAFPPVFIIDQPTMFCNFAYALLLIKRNRVWLSELSVNSARPSAAEHVGSAIEYNASATEHDAGELIKHSNKMSDEQKR